MQELKGINKYFIPNDLELEKIKLIQDYLRTEFSYIRLTPTMIDKSIIDASFHLRKVLKESEIVNFSDIKIGEKVLKKALILLQNKYLEKNVSYYRPKTKKGDPRFWIYNLKRHAQVGELVYFTIYEGKLLAIPLNIEKEELEKMMELKFKSQKLLDNEIVKELVDRLKELKSRGWIKSINPFSLKIDPRDAGETLERELGIKPNNLISADYQGEIEVKSKLKHARTSDTLFSCVPNWGKSKVKSSAEMILKYGYPCRKVEKYPDYIDLYVTVKEKPNPQGLYLVSDDEKEELYQYQINDGNICTWEYKHIEGKIKEKHPKTAWLVVETTKINNENYFKYIGLEMTQNPLISQFIMLINNGKLTFDWRGRIKKDGTGYDDKGHAFRLNPKYRNMLFGDLEKIEI